MEELNAIFAILTGVLLRLALPLLITAFAVWLLKRLDARWQHEAEQGASVVDGSQVRLFDQLRCWAAKECPKENLAKCTAYQERNRPCWQVFRDESGQLREDCLGCEVFNKAPVPVEV